MTPTRTALRRCAAALAAVALALATARHGRAAAAPAEKPSLAEATSEMFATLKPLIDASNWDGALALIGKAMTSIDPGSYDAFFLLDIEAKVHLRRDEYAKAIPCWEAALRLADGKGYGEAGWSDETARGLAQLYSMVGQAVRIPGGDAEAERAEARRLAAVQKDDYTKAIAYMERWMRSGRPPTEADALLYSDLLYNLAVASGSSPDRGLFERAIAAARKGLRLAIHPGDSLYLIIVSGLEQLGRTAEAAEYLELMVHLFPDKSRAYWPQLMQAYLSVASQSENDPLKARRYSIRAITAIERAQAAGFLKEPRNTFNLVTIYFNLERFRTAAQLLGDGLRAGTLEDQPARWQLLAYCYKQLGEQGKAIEIYKEAAQRFPSVGQMDILIAQTYAEEDNLPEAYRYYRSGVKKGGVTSPHGACAYMAYLAFQLQRYDEALAACDEAAKYPEAKEDTQLASLRKYIVETIQSRDAEKARLEKAAAAN